MRTQGQTNGFKRCIKHKVYIALNYFEGWQVILDGRIVDCTKPIFDSMDTSLKGLYMCRNFCEENNYEVIRECR